MGDTNTALKFKYEVDKNSGVDRNSVKLVDESSVVVQNTSLNLEGLDKKAVVDQRVFSQFSCTFIVKSIFC